MEPGVAAPKPCQPRPCLCGTVQSWQMGFGAAEQPPPHAGLIQSQIPVLHPNPPWQRHTRREGGHRSLGKPPPPARPEAKGT